MIQKRRDRLATLCLMIGMFLNPFGFDAIQIMLIELTGNYWNANLVMYCLAGLFFGLYFFFSGNNPIKEIRDILLTIYHNKIKHNFKRR
jgi:hypothetical protein